MIAFPDSTDECDPTRISNFEQVSSVIQALIVNSALSPDEQQEEPAKIVEFVDQYIQESRQSISEEDEKWLIYAMGSYIGDFLISRGAGSTWVEFEGNPGVLLNNGAVVLPFIRVSNLVESGDDGDSIFGFISFIVNIADTPKSELVS